MSEFDKIYAKLSDLTIEAVEQLMIDTEKTDTKYSRLRTCEKIWNHQQSKIDLLKERNEHLEQFRTDTLATIPKLGEKLTEVQQLREDKKKLIEALTFYSGHDNEEFYSYMELRTNGVPRYVELDKDNQVKVNARDYIGKLARKVLSEITR